MVLLLNGWSDLRRKQPRLRPLAFSSRDDSGGASEGPLRGQRRTQVALLARCEGIDAMPIHPRLPARMTCTQAESLDTGTSGE